MRDLPRSGKCEVLFGCYLDNENIVMTHLKMVRGLPKDENTYIKIKTVPASDKNSKYTTDIVKKSEAALFGAQNQVNNYTIFMRESLQTMHSLYKRHLEQNKRTLDAKIIEFVSLNF